MTKQIRFYMVLALAALVLPLYQNCSGGFEVQSGPLSSNAGLDSETPPGSTPDGSDPTPTPSETPDESPTPGPGSTPTPTPTSTPTPTPTPTPSATPAQMKKSFVYVGAVGSIHGFELSHVDDSFKPITTLETKDYTTGWFSYDSVDKRLFTVNGDGEGMRIFNFNATTGQVAPVFTIPFVSFGVHLNVVRKDSKYWIYGASYNSSHFGFQELPVGSTNPTRNKIYTYSGAVRTHSSSVDAKRSLVYVANKDADRIIVYKQANDGTLTENSEIRIARPRIVMVDPRFDLVYVVTESNSGPSLVKIYSPKANGSGFVFMEAGSYEMGLRGGDLKIDHSHNYLVVTVRESQSEGLWALPLTSAGLFDSTRPRRFIPVDQVETRSLHITGNGRYYLVGLNEPANSPDVLVYKITYDQNSAISESKLIHSVDLGRNWYHSIFAIDF